MVIFIHSKKIMASFWGVAFSGDLEVFLAANLELDPMTVLGSNKNALLSDIFVWCLGENVHFPFVRHGWSRVYM